MIHNVELYIFDWSGTISDDRHPVYVANQRMSDFWGVPRISFEHWLPKTIMNVVEYFREAGVTASENEIYALYERTFNEVMRERTLPCAYTDARSALETIRGFHRPITVVSAHPTMNLHTEAIRYELRDLFDEMIGSARNKSAHIRDLLKTYNTAPERALYIGDTVQDVKDAKAAGVTMAALTTGYHTRDILAAANPDAIFDSLTELAHVLSSSR